MYIFQRDLDLEHKVLQWIMSVVHEKPNSDYETFIQDGSILAKVMTSIVFNSVPLEQIDDNWGMVSLTPSLLLNTCVKISLKLS